MKIVKWFAIVTLAAITVYVASTAYKPETKSTLTNAEAVELRVMPWLTAMLESDWEETYNFTSPGYRSGVSLVDHTLKMAARRVTWIGAEILSSECDDEVCRVNIRIIYKVFSPLRGLREFESFETIHTNWIKVDNDWWLVPS